jgi:protein-serine/threonine kinase
VEYLHSNGIVHRDLKLENVLRDRQGRVFLIDFGFSSEIHKYDNILLTACGSPCYAAPELVLDHNGYRGPPVDIWSCGVIMFAISFGFLPFEGDLKFENINEPITWTPKNVNQLYNHIKKSDITLPTFEDPEMLDDNGKDLILKLLKCNPGERITFPDIWEHPFLKCK